MSFSGIAVGTWWPLSAGALALAVLVAVRLRRRPQPFPDLDLLRRSAPAGAAVDYLPGAVGVVIAILLTLSLMNVSLTRSVEAGQRARDYLVIVDTSRSMRENTSVFRAHRPVRFPRRAGPFAGEVANPEEIPELARYELARESLLNFLAARRERDRVGLVYFDSSVDIVSGFTANLESVERQLARMDDYVTGGTNIRWALEQGLDLMSRYPGEHRKAVILLTDAESRDTVDVQRQLDRLRRLGFSFYLLWITTDTVQSASAATRSFLRAARTVGSVYTIHDLAEGYLDRALEEIAELEDYAYDELRHQRVDLSPHFLAGARWLTLVWGLMLGTLYLPLRRPALVSDERW